MCKINLILTGLIFSSEIGSSVIFHSDIIEVVSKFDTLIIFPSTLKIL